MQQLDQSQLKEVSGGDFFGPMFNSILSGGTESERAIGLTCLGTGVMLGMWAGMWIKLGVAAVGAGYLGWDWYTSGETPVEESQP